MFTMEQLIVIIRHMPIEEEAIHKILAHMMKKKVSHRKRCV